MNKEYIKELFEDKKEVFIHSELDIETPKDLEDYMEAIIISNMQFDFNISPNADKLFNRNKFIICRNFPADYASVVKRI